MENKDIIVVSVSFLSLLISLITLFLNLLKPSKLSYIIHERIQGLIANGKFGLLTGITINNSGVHRGLIENIEIQLTKKEKNASTVKLNWDYFYSEDNISTNSANIQTHTVFKSWPHPIIIAGKASESMYIRLITKENWRPEPGNFLCEIHIKYKKFKTKNKTLKKELVINSDNLASMTEQVNGILNAAALSWL